MNANQSPLPSILSRTYSSNSIVGWTTPSSRRIPYYRNCEFIEPVIPFIFIHCYLGTCSRLVEGTSPTLVSGYTKGLRPLTEPFRSGDQSNLIHDTTYCDLCMKKIRGVWYRCAYCSSDMCDLHEQTHNENHCCIVFKSKVGSRYILCNK
jgi:hypothetical protein